MEILNSLCYRIWWGGKRAYENQQQANKEMRKWNHVQWEPTERNPSRFNLLLIAMNMHAYCKQLIRWRCPFLPVCFLPFIRSPSWHANGKRESIQFIGALHNSLKDVRKGYFAQWERKEMMNEIEKDHFTSSIHSSHLCIECSLSIGSTFSWASRIRMDN